MLRIIVIGVVVGLATIACSGDADESLGSAGGGGPDASPNAGGGSGVASDDGGTRGGSGGSAGADASGGREGGGAGGGSSGTSGGTSGSSGQGGTGGLGGAAGDSGACASPSGKGPCDTVPQCGCLPSENCDVIAADGTTACVSTGTVLPWNSCSDFAQCTKGYTCVSGVCSAFCENAASVCPGTNARCVQPTIDGTGIPGMYVCTRACNPVDPSQDNETFDACGPGLGCYPSMTSDSYCYGPTTATGSQWADCADLSGNPDDSMCAPGYICSASLMCVKYCLMESPYCPDGTQCYNFNPVQFAADKSIGYCS